MATQWPRRLASPLTTLIAFLEAHPEIVLVRFVLFGQAALRAYEAALGELSPAGSDPATG